MNNKRYYPLFDKFYYITASITFVLVTVPLLICGIHAPGTLFITIPIFLFAAYFFISPLFAYVELGENELFIKFGLMMTKRIPYGKIRKTEKERTGISPSVLSIKNAMEHVNIRYNTFDVTTVSVKDNDAFIEELNKRMGK